MKGDTFVKKDPRKEEDGVPVNRKVLEEQLRSAERNYELRPPINRHAHDDRSHRG